MRIAWQSSTMQSGSFSYTSNTLTLSESGIGLLSFSFCRVASELMVRQEPETGLGTFASRRAGGLATDQLKRTNEKQGSCWTAEHNWLRLLKCAFCSRSANQSAPGPFVISRRRTAAACGHWKKSRLCIATPLLQAGLPIVYDKEIETTNYDY